jgi:hypothetical protein
MSTSSGFGSNAVTDDVDGNLGAAPSIREAHGPAVELQAGGLALDAHLEAAVSLRRDDENWT